MGFRRDGAQHFPGVLTAEALDALRAAADEALAQSAGARTAISPTGAEVAQGVVGDIARSLIGEAAQPVRAVFFDKTPDANWAVGWHQDRTIVVRDRVEVEGFGPWSTKQGLLHVAPPAEILAGMATLRVHIDPCDENNAPLIVALGTHRLGRVPSGDAARQARAAQQRICLAGSGDVWAYSTLILHGSARAAEPRRRRVLQIDYAACDLPGGLHWRGLGA